MVIDGEKKKGGKCHRFQIFGYFIKIDWLATTTINHHHHHHHGGGRGSAPAVVGVVGIGVGLSAGGGDLIPLPYGLDLEGL